MIGYVVQTAVLVFFTHGFRAVAKRLGPRRGGLLTGLPTTTALMLVGCGLEYGVGAATAASEACLAGLVAAVSLPLAYARAVNGGRRVAEAAGAAVLGYLAVALGLWWLPGAGTSACVIVAGGGVLVVCRAAGRLPGQTPDRPDKLRPISRRWTLAYRTAVPVVYCLAIRGLRVLAGTGAGRFITFPGSSLAVLIATHLESGPDPAVRMASAMPVGGLGMLAFLAVFRFGSPALGLAWGTAAGYAAALAVLAAVNARQARSETPTTPAGGAGPHSGSATGRSPVRRRSITRGARPAPGLRPDSHWGVGRGRLHRPARARRRRFAPKVEFLAG